MGKKSSRQGTLVYPKHAFRPDDLLHFIETRWFTRDWDDLKLPDEELGTLQIAIMCDPQRWPVIRGTSGLRKMRYAPSGWDKGKSDGLRVCYVYFERYYTVALVVVYPKSEQDDLPNAAKRAINAAVARIEEGLRKRFE